MEIPVPKIAPRIGIVIVSFENPELLVDCLESIRQNTYKNIEVIIVDNSISGLVEKRISGMADIHYFRSGDNVGFCRASNFGINKAIELKCNYSLLLNYDTVIALDCLRLLVEKAETTERLGILVGKIYYLSRPTKIWYGGGRIDLFMGVGKHFGYNLTDTGQFDSFREVTYATGCCMLVPNAVFQDVGFLKPEIFMYLDDAHFSLKVMSAGYRIFYLPKAVLYHAVGPGSDYKKFPAYYLYFSIRNRPLITEKFFYGIYLHVLAVVLGLVKLFIYCFSPGVPQRRTKLVAILFGIFDSLDATERYRKRFPALFK